MAKILSEAQVRRFQSLASIKPLNEMDSSYKKHDDEDEVAMKDYMMEVDETLMKKRKKGWILRKMKTKYKTLLSCTKNW